MKKFIKVGVISALLAIVMSTAAYAGTAYKKYVVGVGRFNGSGYTEEQTKKTTGTRGRIDSDTVGGDYVVDVRMVNNSGKHGSWVRDLSDNMILNIPVVDALAAGTKVKLEFSNDITTPVNVAVQGRWKSN